MRVQEPTGVKLLGILSSPSPGESHPMSTQKSGFGWRLHGDGRSIKPGSVVAPSERLAWPITIGIGAQHVVAMFGATFLVPLLTGFPPATTLFFSGLGTVLFLLITRGRVPSYLGSSFAFIAPLAAATNQHGPAGALGGIVMAGLSLFLVGVIVQFCRYRLADEAHAARGDRRDRGAHRLQPGTECESELHEGAHHRTRNPHLDYPDFGAVQGYYWPPLDSIGCDHRVCDCGCAGRGRLLDH